MRSGSGCPKRGRPARWRSLLVAAAVAVSGCYSTHWSAEFHKPDELPAANSSAQFLKCHLKDGTLVVLTDWKVKAEERVVQGEGRRFAAKRELTEEGAMAVAFDDVTLFESNEAYRVLNAGLVLVGVMGVLSMGITLACATNPKACFGSCPTFYVERDGEWHLTAEGFSQSVARVLEVTDVDAMLGAEATNGVLELAMTNEALETHYTRHLRVAVLPHMAGQAVYRQGDDFYLAGDARGPERCEAMGPDCRELVAHADGKEYRTEADGEDLASREHVRLSFVAPGGPVGLVLVARNSLMNTFLFYQGLAYMGREMGSFLARMERGEGWLKRGVTQMDALLGRIDVSVARQGEMVTAGRFEEVGPLARERQLILLPGEPVAGSTIDIELSMTQGYWRLDRAAVVPLLGTVEPRFVPVSRVYEDGEERPEIASLLSSRDGYLVTLPGDALRIQFDVGDELADYFLEATGYYYEWMRDEWLADEDHALALKFLVQPGQTLRDLAPAFKEVEAQMEEAFWNSRVGGVR